MSSCSYSHGRLACGARSGRRDRPSPSRRPSPLQHSPRSVRPCALRHESRVRRLLLPPGLLWKEVGVGKHRTFRSQSKQCGSVHTSVHSPGIATHVSSSMRHMTRFSRIPLYLVFQVGQRRYRSSRRIHSDSRAIAYTCRSLVHTASRHSLSELHLLLVHTPRPRNVRTGLYSGRELTLVETYLGAWTPRRAHGVGGDVDDVLTTDMAHSSTWNMSM